MQAGQRVSVTQAEQRQGGCLRRLQEVIQQSLGGRPWRAGLGLLRPVCWILRAYTPSGGCGHESVRERCVMEHMCTADATKTVLSTKRAFNLVEVRTVTSSRGSPCKDRSWGLRRRASLA